MNTLEIIQKPLMERLNGGNGFDTAVNQPLELLSLCQTMTSFCPLRSLLLFFSSFLNKNVFTFLFNIHGDAQPDRKHAKLQAHGIYF